jgi:hypothetical protein
MTQTKTKKGIRILLIVASLLPGLACIALGVAALFHALGIELLGPLGKIANGIEVTVLGALLLSVACMLWIRRRVAPSRGGDGASSESIEASLKRKKIVKLLAGILMVTAGVVGLYCTTCGIAFVISPAGALGLIGILPGTLLLWLTVKLWSDFFSK